MSVITEKIGAERQKDTGTTGRLLNRGMIVEILQSPIQPPLGHKFVRNGGIIVVGPNEPGFYHKDIAVNTGLIPASAITTEGRILGIPPSDLDAGVIVFIAECIKNGDVFGINGVIMVTGFSEGLPGLGKNPDAREETAKVVQRIFDPRYDDVDIQAIAS